MGFSPLFFLLLEPPPTPQNLSILDIQSRSVKIAWTVESASPAVDRLVVQWKEQTGKYVYILRTQKRPIKDMLYFLSTSVIITTVSLMLFMYFLVLVYVRRQYYYIVHTTISTHSFAANNILVRFGIFLYLLGITRQILFLYYRRMVSSRKTKYFAGSND